VTRYIESTSRRDKKVTGGEDSIVMFTSQRMSYHIDRSRFHLYSLF